MLHVHMTWFTNQDILLRYVRLGHIFLGVVSDYLKSSNKKTVYVYERPISFVNHLSLAKYLKACDL